MHTGQTRHSSTLFTSDEHQSHKSGSIDYCPPDVIIGIQCNFQYILIGHKGNFYQRSLPIQIYFLKHNVKSSSADTPLPVEKIDVLRSNFCKLTILYGVVHILFMLILFRMHWACLSLLPLSRDFCSSHSPLRQLLGFCCLPFSCFTYLFFSFMFLLFLLF